MSPLPAAVLTALAICADHTTSLVSNGGYVNWTCLKTATCAMGSSGGGRPAGWSVGYEKCQAIYDKAERLQEIAAEKQRTPEETRENAKAIKAAAKDQAKLDAALAALDR